jgi:hypothetical protein
MDLTIRSARRITAVAAAACAVILAPAIALAASGNAGTVAGGATVPGAAASPAVAPGCQTPGLVIWLDTNGNGAAGSVFYHLEFTNLSGRRCTLNGFPFITAVSLRGHQLGRRAAFSGTPHVVTLGAGRTVTALLQVVEVGNFSRSACRPVTAAGFRVFPPNQTRSKVVPFPFGACSRSGPVFLTVGPVRG